jgi:two-component system chemotaxis sensor kinase CheA
MIDLSLLEDFVTGASESLDEMENALLELETQPNNIELLNTIFRAMHTIKGAAQFVGLERVSALSHVLEDLLDLLRNEKKQVTPEIVDLLIKTKDRISSLVADLERTQTENTEVDDLTAQINLHLSSETSIIAESPTIPAQAADLPLEQEDAGITSFLEETSEAEDLSAFLTEENLEEDLGSFLSEGVEQDLDFDFLTEEKQAEAIVEATASDDELAAFLMEETQSKPAQEQQLSVETKESQDQEEFVLPEEEYDQELFGIFIQQLQEKASLLKTYVDSLSFSDNKRELLNSAVEVLESLKFSANYMGYEKLTHFYAKWMEEVGNSQEELLEATRPVSFEFMDAYLSKLQNIFPQLQLLTASAPQQVQVTAESSLEASLDRLTAAEPEEIESAFISDFIETQPESVVTQQPQPTLQIVTSEKPVLETEKEELVTVAEEDDLFKKLSSALDSSIEEAITSEPINELFGALLATTKEEQSRAKAEKEHELRLEVKTLAEANQEPPALVEITAAQQQPSPLPEPKKKPVSAPEKTEVVPEKITDAVAKKAKPESSTEKAFKKSIRVDADKIDSLMNQVGELIVDRAYFFQLATEINELQQYLKNTTGLGQKDLKPVRTFAYRFSEAVISLGRTSNELQEGVMKVRMLPIAQIFNRYPRLVHDLAHTHSKKVQLEIRGEETELDKMIIEEISDPLIHMIRNAIGHGIETPDIRKKLGKPETGTLVLEAYHESNHIVIEVTDDGKGIDTEGIKAKAEEMALFSKDELSRMTKDDLTRFIMMPGFSTAKEINSTSGRGVGMDVVKKNIEKLNGTIEVESKFGVETKIRLKIPLTLAIIQALLVRVGVDSFTIPLANVEETLRVSASEISIMEDTEVMYLRGKTLPIFRLATLFKLKSAQQPGETDFFVVVVNTGNQRVGLMVDALLGQEEVVIKPLADYLHENNCFSGATIIGDGRISLILDVYELITMTTEKQIKKHHEQEKRSLASLAD